MALRIRHGVMRVGEAFPRHDVNQPAQPVWPRVRVAPRAKSDSRQLPAWVGWLAYGALALLVLQIVAIFLPLTWGWQWHNLGCDSKSWSMTAPGGVMPLSQYWIAKQPEYAKGDIVSFQYREGGCADNNGASVKLVDDTAPGKAHVHGMNKANSMLPCWVAVSDINGKIVAGPISLLPTAFWRWATMGWTLGQEDVVRRIRGLEMFPLRIFTEQGRLWNLAQLSYPPGQRLRTKGGDIFVQGEDGALALGSGQCLRGSTLDVPATKYSNEIRALRKMRLGNKELWRYLGRRWEMVSLDARQGYLKVKVGDDEIVIGGREQSSYASPDPLHYACVVRNGQVIQLITTPEMVSPTIVTKTANGLVVQGDVGHHLPPGVQPLVMVIELRKTEGVWRVFKSGLMPALFFR